MSRRRPMIRIGDLLPDAARGLGLEGELRLSRASATFDQLIGERVPSVAGLCHVSRVDGSTLLVEADAPIVAQELRLRGPELLRAFAATPAGAGVGDLRIVVARSPGSA
jgi:Dna[CI] antecedent DciA-like protein